MNKQLDQQLCATYPEIFRDRHASMDRTAMCWGFDCGDGWYALIDTLCGYLMGPVKQARDDVRSAELALQFPEKQTEWSRSFYTPEKLAEYRAKLAELEARIPIAVQVKEKFGTLRFYVNNHTDEQLAVIHFAELLSARMCEECGATRIAKTYREGWHSTLCDTCAEKDGRIVVRAEETPSGAVLDENTMWGV